MEKLQSKNQAGFKWLLALLIPVLVYLMPMGESITPEMKRFLAITLWAILMFMFELLDNAVVAIALTFGYALLQIVPMSTALAAWTNGTVWMVFACLVIVNVVQKTKLLERVAYSLIVITDGSYRGILLGIATLCIIFCLLVPSVTTGVVTVAIAYGICKALNLGTGKAAGGIMLASVICFTEASNFLYVPQCIGLSASVVGVAVNYITILKHNWVFIPLVYLMAFIISIVMKPEHPIEGKEVFRQKKQDLGVMTLEEKKILAVLLLIMFYLFTNPLHGLDMTYGFIFGMILLFIPNIGVGTKEDIENVNMGLIIFIVACMTIGTAGGAIGIGGLIAEKALPYLEDSSPYVFVALVWLIGVICNFFMTPLALMTVLGGPFASVAASLGISGYSVAYALHFAGNNLLFPYENTTFLICYGFGLIYMKDFIKTGFVKMVVCLIYSLIIGVTYWNLIGLF